MVMEEEEDVSSALLSSQESDDVVTAGQENLGLLDAGHVPNNALTRHVWTKSNKKTGMREAT